MRVILTGLRSLGVAVVVGVGAYGAQGDSPTPADAYRVLDSWVLGGDGGWDLLSVDATARRLYVARANRTMVVDADTGTLIGEIPGNGVHGIAVVPEVHRGFVTNGKDQNVTIFDLANLQVIGHAATGPKPDAIAYDPASRRVFVCNNGGTTLTVLTPATGAVEATIDVGGSPELVAVDGAGRLYTNLEDKDRIAVVDTKGLTLVGSHPLAPGAGPSGVAVDPAHHRVFSVCHDSKTLEVLDADSGAVVATVPIGAGADGAAFDPVSGLVFSPNGDGTITAVHEDDPDHYSVAQTIATKRFARTIAFDAATRHLYLVTADPDTTESDAHKRPNFRPGTFTVLVVGTPPVAAGR